MTEYVYNAKRLNNKGKHEGKWIVLTRIDIIIPAADEKLFAEEYIYKFLPEIWEQLSVCEKHEKK